jgi:PAS domain S-box-containing protein
MAIGASIDMLDKELDHKINVILDNLDEGVFIIDNEWKIKSFNQAAEKITGIATEEAIGRQCWEVFRVGICESRCPIRHAMETGQPFKGDFSFIVNLHGERIPVSISAALLMDEDNQVIAGLEAFRDLSLD